MVSQFVHSLLLPSRFLLLPSLMIGIGLAKPTLALEFHSGVGNDPSPHLLFSHLIAQSPQVISRPTLQLGSRGEFVTELQILLKLLDFYGGPVDGIYGQVTATAVTDFQHSGELKPTGIVSNTTWQLLFPRPSDFENQPQNRVSAPDSQPSDRDTIPISSSPVAFVDSIGDRLPILREGMRGSLVERLQLNLQRLGFYSGKVDGIFGAQTLESVKAVQAKFNLEVDGIVGAKTWLVILQ